MSLVDFLAIGSVAVLCTGVVSASLFLSRGPDGPRGRRVV